MFIECTLGISDPCWWVVYCLGMFICIVCVCMYLLLSGMALDNVIRATTLVYFKIQYNNYITLYVEGLSKMCLE